MTEKEFETIASELRAVMFSIGIDFFGNEMDAEDIAQEGLIALWKYIKRMEAGKNHKALAIRIAKHCCMDLVRKRRNVVPLYSNVRNEEDIAPPGSEISPSPQEEIEAGELHTAISDAIGNLNPSERRLYELRQIEGKSLDEIVEETNIAKPSVKSIISMARKKVFEELKKINNQEYKSILEK